MTNLDKFIEMMNSTFGAKLTPEKMKLKCSPCGILQWQQYACDQWDCEKCKGWWHKEWRKK